jgi:hypothetical protein
MGTSNPDLHQVRQQIIQRLLELHRTWQDIGYKIEDLTIAVENIDLSQLESKPAKSNRGRLDTSRIKPRADMLKLGQQYLKGAAIRDGWQEGGRQPWSLEAIGDRIAGVSGNEGFDVRRLYEWKAGKGRDSAKTAHLIETTLRELIANYHTDGVEPVEPSEI